MHVSGSNHSTFDVYSSISFISKMAALGIVLGGTAALVKHVYTRNSNSAVKSILESRGKTMPESDEVTACFKCGTFEAYTSHDAKWKVRANKMILSFSASNLECHIKDSGIFKLTFEKGKPILTRAGNHCTIKSKKEATT
ncbi:MAG TPA: hypothetical protein VLG49_00390 [Rhabdochlamydiaceae bacterium]|nr:hypothetical protein [Rhabdochlamydiaceae bacterium]